MLFMCSCNEGVVSNNKIIDLQKKEKQRKCGKLNVMFKL